VDTQTRKILYNIAENYLKSEPIPPLNAVFQPTDLIHRRNQRNNTFKTTEMQGSRRHINNKIISLFFLVWISLLSPLSLKSQQIDATTESNFNIKFLEYLLKKEIDSVRESHKLDILINDSILYLASLDQSEYLTKQKELTHFQKNNPAKFSPQNRADYYGANNYRVGENVLFTTVNQYILLQELIDADVYKSIAHSMMLLWVNSPGHFANIINAEYDITGVSISFDSETNRLYATQAFAIVNPHYQYKPCSSLFPYDTYNEALASRKFVPFNTAINAHKRHAFNIKKDNPKKQCCSEARTAVFNYKTIMLTVFYDTIYLAIKKSYAAKIRHFFTNKKDGILLEFLDFDYTYSCNLPDNVRIPTRDNGGCIFNGQITAPVYKDSVLYYMDKNKTQRSKNSDFVSIPLGKYPEKLKGKKIDINILILQKNRLCKVIQTQGICGRIMEPEIPRFDLLLHLDSIEYRPSVKTQKNEYKVFFNKNDINIINPDTLYYLRNILKQENLFVNKIILNAYASVEGSLETNQFLYTKRAENIRKIFQADQDSSIQLITNVEENWQMFFSQLKQSDYSYLLGLDTAQIRDSINVPGTSQKLEPLLSRQRYGQVIIYYKPQINDQNIDEYAFSEYKKLCKTPTPESSQIARLKKTTSFLLYRCLKNRIALDSLEAQITNEKKFAVICHQLFLFNLKYITTNYSGAAESLKTLKEYALNQNNESASRYNYLAYLFNSRKYTGVNPKLSEIKEFLNLIKHSKLPSDSIKEFELYYHFKYLNFLYSNGWTYKSVSSSLSFIKEYYLNNPPNDNLRYELALYFISFNQYKTSLELLEPMVSNDQINKEAYILYLKVYDQLQIAGIKSNSEELLIEAADRLSTIDWCNLFIGPCNIRFQIFDNNALRRVYCEKCNAGK